MKKSVNAKNAPAAVGPYVHGVEVNGLFFASGQLGLDKDTGELKEGIEAQAKQCLDNLGEVLKAAGFDYEDVVKTTVFIKNIDDFGIVNEIYGGYFKENPPARSCVEVSRLPKGALLEIDVIASK